MKKNNKQNTKIDGTAVVYTVSHPPQPKAKWQQTGLSITKSTIMRLRLESVKSVKTMSEITEAILDKYLPHNRIAS